MKWHRSVRQQHLTSVAGDDACSARAIALELCVVSRGWTCVCASAQSRMYQHLRGCTAVLSRQLEHS